VILRRLSARAAGPEPEKRVDFDFYLMSRRLISLPGKRDRTEMFMFYWVSQIGGAEGETKGEKERGKKKRDGEKKEEKTGWRKRHKEERETKTNCG